MSELESTNDNISSRFYQVEVLRESAGPSVVGHINEYLAGLHLVHFRHWLLRWFYVIGGLAGCVCIATGFLFFVEKRKRQHAEEGQQGVRVVDALAVTTVTGMVIATLGILIANRLLPETLPAGWPKRGDLERYAFWFCWFMAMAHAFCRTAPVATGRMAPAWREQCWAIAGMAVSAVLLNWITTGDHLLRTLRETYWPVAGLDLAMLATASIALLAARRLKQRDTALARDSAGMRRETARA